MDKYTGYLVLMCIRGIFLCEYRVAGHLKEEEEHYCCMQAYNVTAELG